jgi:hypothetical protein
MANEKLEGLLSRIERGLVLSALALAVGAWFYDHEAFVCVLASGLFIAMNFRLWRMIAAWSRHLPGLLYLALFLKVPLLAVGIYLLLQLGKPWMVALGTSNLLVAMLLGINPNHLQRDNKR